jgi:hypothetical protein
MHKLEETGRIDFDPINLGLNCWNNHVGEVSIAKRLYCFLVLEHLYSNVKIQGLR